MHVVYELEARKRCWFMDSEGLVYDGRGSRTSEKSGYAHTLLSGLQDGGRDSKSLENMVNVLKPTCMIGVSTMRGAFTEQVIGLMCEFNEHPIVLALSNPTSKSECTAEEAYRFSKGKAVFASGSPFEARRHRSMWSIQKKARTS